MEEDDDEGVNSSNYTKLTSRNDLKGMFFLPSRCSLMNHEMDFKSKEFLWQLRRIQSPVNCITKYLN